MNIQEISSAESQSQTTQISPADDRHPFVVSRLVAYGRTAGQCDVYSFDNSGKIASHAVKRRMANQLGFNRWRSFHRQRTISASALRSRRRPGGHRGFRF
jgi:hypothetical protein